METAVCTPSRFRTFRATVCISTYNTRGIPCRKRVVVHHNVMEQSAIAGNIYNNVMNLRASIHTEAKDTVMFFYNVNRMYLQVYVFYRTVVPLTKHTTVNATRPTRAILRYAVESNVLNSRLRVVQSIHEAVGRREVRNAVPSTVQNAEDVACIAKRCAIVVNVVKQYGVLMLFRRSPSVEFVNRRDTQSIRAYDCVINVRFRCNNDIVVAACDIIQRQYGAAYRIAGERFAVNRYRLNCAEVCIYCAEVRLRARNFTGPLRLRCLRHNRIFNVYNRLL